MQQVEEACAAVLASGVTIIGLDIEWWARFKTGEGQRPVALIQICYQTPQRPAAHYTCLLIHICRSGTPAHRTNIHTRVRQSHTPFRGNNPGHGFWHKKASSFFPGQLVRMCVSCAGPTPSLIALLESPDIRKAGVGISGDKNKLERDLGCVVGSVVCLNEEANRRQMGTKGTLSYEYVIWRLCELTEKLLKRSLAKENDVRCCNWELLPLPNEQQCYAASDAFASLLVWQALMQCPLLDTPHLKPASFCEEDF